MTNPARSATILVLMALLLVILPTGLVVCGRSARAPSPEAAPAFAAPPMIPSLERDSSPRSMPLVGATTLRNAMDSTGLFTWPLTARSQDGSVRIVVSSNTRVTSDEGDTIAELSVALAGRPPIPEPDFTVIGAAYRIAPGSVTFAPPVTATFVYDPDAVPEGLDPKRLALRCYDEETGAWAPLDSIEVFPASHTAVGKLARPGVLMLVARTRPASLATADLTIYPAVVAPGEPVSVTATIENSGDIGANCEVNLTVDGSVTATETMNIPGQGSRRLTFSVRPGGTGVHVIEVNGRTVSMEVRTSSSPVPPVSLLPPRPPVAVEAKSPGTPVLRQTIEYVLPAAAASWSGRSVSYVRYLKAGQKINGYVEIENLQNQPGEVRDDWYIDVYDPTGVVIYSWQGNWRVNFSNTFERAATMAGRYRIRVKHSATIAQRLFLNLSPQDWNYIIFNEP